MTKLIYQFEGSLGSRLHQENVTVFIASAQWPDKTNWQNSGNRLPEQANEYRSKMREACEKIETLHELELLEDLLQNKPS